MGLFNVSKKDNVESEFTCRTVVYKGGHSLFLSKSGMLSPMGPTGTLYVKKNIIIFDGKNIEINMPINKIDFSDVRQWQDSRGTQQQAMAFAGKGMAWGSIGAMSKDFFVEISFIDEKGKRQKPIFEFTNKGNAEKFQKWLYNKLPSESSKSKKQSEAEDPLSVLKLRYAKGQISKKEYERMKKELS